MGRRASASAARRWRAARTAIHSPRTSVGLSSCAPTRAMTTRSTPCGRRSGHARKHSRQTRLMRFRLTAEPTLLLTTIPIRAICDSASVASATGCFATNSVKCGVATRRPVRCARTNSRCLRSRRPLPKVSGGAASALDVARDIGRPAATISCRSPARGAFCPYVAGSKGPCGPRA
jgi:hypothetical protein